MIRTKEDRGTILLMDDRFLDRDYRNLFPREWSDLQICSLETVEIQLKEFWISVEGMDCNKKENKQENH